MVNKLKKTCKEFVYKKIKRRGRYYDVKSWMDHYEKYYVPPGKTREYCRANECPMLPEYEEKEYDIVSYL